MTVTEIISIFGIIMAILGGVIAVLERKTQRKASEDVREAERQAFIEQPTAFATKLESLTESQEGLEARAEQVVRLLEESRDAISLGRLFNLYSKQIEKYQQETRTRATWSFVFAILSMISGFGFIIWGGSVLLTAKETIVLAAGGMVSTLGGAISGYITKTFLDVHRLSLTQLNRYFQQPAINDHILMAQRLADGLDDEEGRKKAYEKIIDSMTKLIVHNQEATSN